MVVDNLAFVQHLKTLRYVNIQRDGYISDSSLQIQSKRLCILTNCTNYSGCDYEMCYFVCAKGITF